MLQYLRDWGMKCSDHLSLCLLYYLNGIWGHLIFAHLSVMLSNAKILIFVIILEPWKMKKLHIWYEYSLLKLFQLHQGWWPCDLDYDLYSWNSNFGSVFMARIPGNQRGDEVMQLPRSSQHGQVLSVHGLGAWKKVSFSILTLILSNVTIRNKGRIIFWLFICLFVCLLSTLAFAVIFEP